MDIGAGDEACARATICKGRRKSDHHRESEKKAHGKKWNQRKERKRNVKIRATEKKERKIKTHILREQTESPKMGKEKERS